MGSNSACHLKPIGIISNLWRTAIFLFLLLVTSEASICSGIVWHWRKDKEMSHANKHCTWRLVSENIATLVFPCHELRSYYLLWYDNPLVILWCVPSIDSVYRNINYCYLNICSGVLSLENKYTVQYNLPTKMWYTFVLSLPNQYCQRVTCHSRDPLLRYSLRCPLNVPLSFCHLFAKRWSAPCCRPADSHGNIPVTRGNH